ncbi:hypothetical protein RHGRI_003801 [Rhododendron griersonianum]|uniref:Uncharacterized protein n=1 Tax=Rhododendron griersonianum TaxID=479676 RepID=A0AAV6L756_9ERIC|nr:hypothetical protein RHGRI_003801 [Rhododendron griersonianum]
MLKIITLLVKQKRVDALPANDPLHKVYKYGGTPRVYYFHKNVIKHHGKTCEAIAAAIGPGLSLLCDDRAAMTHLLEVFPEGMTMLYGRMVFHLYRISELHFGVMLVVRGDGGEYPLGKGFIEEGLKWELGDGSSIDPFCNEWIPFVSNPCGSVSANRWFSSSKVSDLINWESRSWRIPLLSFLFPPEVVLQSQKLGSNHDASNFVLADEASSRGVAQEGTLSVLVILMVLQIIGAEYTFE